MDCLAGNVKTSDFYQTNGLPKRFENPGWFYGYGTHRRPQPHPFYNTTSSEYGRFAPSIHSVPTKYFPRNQAFSRGLAEGGPYRNYSLNTGTNIY
ncbi:unnamed protein product [Brassicogethes aeneus]|uniref:Uncharacterized protein n=1 Tax=Brassicogethes aeneus TaxID=1431903 RepID=A0A9P0B474_BRAAE|nr:unnamed protein product [Brassicogethes aeneus]